MEGNVVRFVGSCWMFYGGLKSVVVSVLLGDLREKSFKIA